MVNPVPGYQVTTPYRKTGPSWKTCGYHTGQDYAAPLGTQIVAARGGSVVHVNYGSALGNHQFVIRPGDGTEDLYCHTSSRPGNGAQVAAGQHVAKVGNEGNSTGPHLHFERHKSYGWACSVFDDPMKSHNYVGGTGGWMFSSGTKVYQDYLVWKGHEKNSDKVSNSIKCWQEMLNHHSLQGGKDIPTTGQWFEQTASETQKCQTQHIPPADTPLEAVYVGPKQFEHVRSATSCPYVFVPGGATAAPLPPDPPVSGAVPPQPALMAPGAVWDPIAKTDGGYFEGLRQFVGAAHKVTLHTTETSVKPNWEGKQSGIPHFTLEPSTGRLWQHLPLYMAAYTMKAGDYSPNSDSGTNIQIEIIGFSSQSNAWPTEQYEVIERLLQWISTNLLVPYAFPAVFADYNNYERMTWPQWEPTSGVLGHQHAPYNDHWDPGPLDVKRLTRDDVAPPAPEEVPPGDEGKWENLWERYSDYVWVLVIAILLAAVIASLV